MSDDIDTLGVRLDAAARRRARSWEHVPDWLRLSQPLLGRTSTAPRGARFQRVEAGDAQEGPPSSVSSPAAPAPLSGTTARPGVPPHEVGGVPWPLDLRRAAESLRWDRSPDADARARRAGADAVAVGDSVALRADRRQDAPHELALLAHEATHVAAAGRAGADWHRATSAGRADEERVALQVERAILVDAATGPSAPDGLPALLHQRTTAAAPAPGSVPLTSAGRARAGSATSPSQRPATAPVGRDLEAPPATPSAPPSPPGSTGPALTDAVYRELLQRLRVELERGA